VDGADSSGVGFRLESSQEQLPTSIAGVLRLRAMKPSVSDRSAKRFAQDDDFVVSWKCSAQDDVFVVSWRCKKPASSRISIVCQTSID
jgi:hypothetical protein